MEIYPHSIEGTFCMSRSQWDHVSWVVTKGIAD
jgi:hypothetical protein